MFPMLRFQPPNCFAASTYSTVAQNLEVVSEATILEPDYAPCSRAIKSH